MLLITLGFCQCTAGGAEGTPIIHVIPHSHCDAGYGESFDEYWTSSVHRLTYDIHLSTVTSAWPAMDLLPLSRLHTCSHAHLTSSSTHTIFHAITCTISVLSFLTHDPPPPEGLSIFICTVLNVSIVSVYLFLASIVCHQCLSIIVSFKQTSTA